MWAGETYWLLMPFKWREEGVVLSYEGEEELDGKQYDKVRLTFEEVGVSPGDSYLAYVNRETHLMERWQFKLEGGAEGDYRWTRWYRYGGILLATERVSSDETIRFDDIFIGESMPDELFTSHEPIDFP